MEAPANQPCAPTEPALPTDPPQARWAQPCPGVYICTHPIPNPNLSSPTSASAVARRRSSLPCSSLSLWRAHRRRRSSPAWVRPATTVHSAPLAAGSGGDSCGSGGRGVDRVELCAQADRGGGRWLHGRSCAGAPRHAGKRSSVGCCCRRRRQR